MNGKNRTQQLQIQLKEDLLNIKSIKLDTSGVSDFYKPLIGVFCKYFFILSLINLLVVYGLALNGAIYLRDISHLTRDILIPNTFFALVAVMVLSQFYAFKSLAHGKIKSLDYIQGVINTFELIFFGLYVVVYTLCLQSEGDINGTIMGASITTFVITALLMVLVVTLESQRVGLPVITKLISQLNDKRKQDSFLPPQDDNDRS